MKTKPTSKTCGYTKMVFSSALRFRFRTRNKGPDYPDCPAGARIVKGRTLCGTLTAVLLGLLALPPTGSTDTQTLSDYSAFPPFMSATVQPNILLILDNSGSMNEFAILFDFVNAVFDHRDDLGPAGCAEMGAYVELVNNPIYQNVSESGYIYQARLYALYYETGTPYSRDVFSLGTPPLGTVLERSVPLGQGRPSSLAIHVGQEKGGKIYVQQSTGSIEELVMRTPFGQKSGSVLWYED
jgi:hypothetical protein